MKVFEKVQEVRAELLTRKLAGETIGFVPTMGALHAGHLSLLEQARRETDATVVSIFVNPTQFDKAEDLANYPRLPEEDLAMLREAGCDLVFMPGVEEVYPETDTRAFQFGILDTVMEAAHRPGHFNGVAQVVSRLFDIVQPHKAFFGQKDYQQLLVIRELCRLLEYPVMIVECPIVREPDGLAMSSRNLRLSREERNQAPFIYQTLKEAVGKLHFATVENIRNQVAFQFSQKSSFRLEYFEVAEQNSLKPVSGKVNSPAVACLAAWLGPVRLIDNMKFNPKR